LDASRKIGTTCKTPPERPHHTLDSKLFSLIVGSKDGQPMSVYSETPNVVIGSLHEWRSGSPSREWSGTRAKPVLRYSFVIPVFNEEAVLPALLLALDNLLASLDGPAEVVFVDDGSRDNGAELIRDRTSRDSRFRVVQLSRNFGHQAAITAGMDYASGAAIIIMDADLQDPPSVVLQMIAKWKEGYDLVYAHRTAREHESHFKRTTAWLFYRIMRLMTGVDIPSDVGDFRLVDRSVIESFRSMRERDRFVRGMFAWMGYRQTAITFTRPERAAGKTKYRFRNMAQLAIDGILGFSDAPLRMVVWAGIAVSFLGMLCGLYAIGLKLWRDDLVPGWASTIVVVAFLSGMNMLMTGIVGLYVGRIHREVKARPLYLVRETVGFTNDSPVALDRQPIVQSM
jgi:dolichol-phosphate mannosyltransferase